MGTYIYTPLKPNDGTIRLMTLLPGDFDDNIRVAINITVLASWNEPVYEALSYTSGSPEHPVNIYVEDSKNHTLSVSDVEDSADNTLSVTDVRDFEDVNLPVTQELATALRHLRFESVERILWVDATCVNQQDVEDRGPQVQRMADIYRNAVGVVAWLGPGRHESRRALTTIQGLSLHLRVDWENMRMKPSSSGDARWADLAKYPDYNREVWTPVLSLLERPWFYRLWTRQEVQLAKSVDLLCGDISLPWKSLRDVMLCLHSEHQPTDRSPREIDMTSCVAWVNTIWGSQIGSTTFLDLLDMTEQCSYTDPRDRVYGIQNLVSIHEPIVSMAPKYSHSPRTVFQNAVLHYLRGEQRLSLLTCCGRHEGLPSKPTWVPDLSRDEICLSLPNCFYSASLAEAEYLGDGLLKATGLCSTYVQWAEPVSPEVGLLAVDRDFEVIQAVRRLWEHVRPNRPYTGHGDFDESFCRTLSAALFAEDYVPRFGDFPTLQKSKDFLADILGTQPASNEHYGLYLERIFACIRGRSFMMTREGYLGVGPKDAKPGDQICKILGCHSLLLLRSAGPQYHTVIGECFVSGLINDKALLGQFTTEWEYVHVKKDPAEHGYYPYFVNHLSGDVEKVDPRLGPLPPGWRIADHDKMSFFNLYVNDATGEGYRYKVEPRMTANALRRRGVQLMEFVLE